MDPSDPLCSLCGRTEWALVTALSVPVLLVALLTPARPAPGGGEQALPGALERSSEPPTALVAPPPAVDVRRTVAPRAARHRAKSDAFDAACERALAAHAAALAPRLARLELTLRDAVTRQPLPGAAVELARDDDRRIRRADARGVLALDLPPGPLALYAWADAATGGPLELELRAGAHAHTALDLHPAHAVEGRVTDARTGRPLAGASVAFWTHAELDRVLTGADGRFHHPRFPAHAPAQQVRIQALGYAPAVRYLELGPGAGWVHRGAHAGERDVVGHALPARIDVALESALVLEGRVLDARGRAVAGATVAAVGYARLLPDVATRDEAHATTDAAGRFRITGLRPDVTHALHVRALVCTGGPGYAEHAELVLEVPACDTDGIAPALDLGDLHLEPPALVAGVLLDAAGEPVVGAEIRLRRVDLPGPSPTSSADPGARPLLASRSVRTDAAGAFLLDGLAAGSYELCARRDRGALATLALELRTAEERDDVRLEPSAPTWTLRGLVRTPSGPLADAAIVVERFGAVAHLRTDHAGRFALAGLDDTATYTVRTAEAGFTRAAAPAWAWEPVLLEVAAELPPVALARGR